jgi:protein MpaA
MGRWPFVACAVMAVLVVVGCADDDGSDQASSSSASAPVTVAPSSSSSSPSTPAVADVAAPTTVSTVPPSTRPATTSPPPPTTVEPGLRGLVTDEIQAVDIGRSVEGRPITAVERGTPGGVPVLVIGVIHGDEDDGVAILERLATAPVPAGVDLWLIESMNPDGQAAQQRWNAGAVDLNRNFPYQWGPIGEPGDPEYAGTGPASEPETQAVVDFVTRIRPVLGLWYHQDLYRLSPGDGLDGQLKERYSELTGLPILRITGGTYTGVAATWQRNTVGGISFIVELGPTLTPAEADTHAAAVLDIAALAADREL